MSPTVPNGTRYGRKETVIAEKLTKLPWVPKYPHLPPPAPEPGLRRTCRCPDQSSPRRLCAIGDRCSRWAGLRSPISCQKQDTHSARANTARQHFTSEQNAVQMTSLNRSFRGLSRPASLSPDCQRHWDFTPTIRDVTRSQFPDFRDTKRIERFTDSRVRSVASRIQPDSAISGDFTAVSSHFWTAGTGGTAMNASS